MVVKPRQHFRDVPELILHTAALCHQRGQPARVGVAAHDDDGFSGPSGGVAEMRDAQVGLRRQPTVEQDLAAQACSRRSAVLKSRKSVATGFFALYALSATSTTTPVCVSCTSA